MALTSCGKNTTLFLHSRFNRPNVPKQQWKPKVHIIICQAFIVYKITVPKPFSFDIGETPKGRRIISKRVKEDLEKQQEEEQAFSQGFKANPVPLLSSKLMTYVIQEFN